MMADAWPQNDADATTIGEYTVLGRIGGGAFGEVGLCHAGSHLNMVMYSRMEGGQGARFLWQQVLRGVHRETGMPVALKHIYIQVPQRGEDAATVRQRQGRELAALRAVDHPNVVRLIDVLSQAGCPAW